jgi:hypothetical protein
MIPTSGPSDWRRLLADPGKQWVKGRSALELAVSWEAARRTARGIPSSVAAVLDSNPKLAGAELLLGIPEQQVPFEGGGHASQTDLWALLRAPVGLVSMAVEAKAGEGFDRTIASWLADAKPTSGKPARFRHLKSILGIGADCPETLRYQLFHRTASAIREAERFGATTAVLLIQSFSSDPESAGAYAEFCQVVGCSPQRTAVLEGPKLGTIQLYFAWVDCEPSGVDQLAGAV